MAELRKDNLSFFEALGQSISSLSPTFTPALGVAVVGGMAGTAAWFVYFCAMVGILIVALNIGELAKRMPSAGSFLIYVSRTLGPAFGMLAGWAMLVAYLFTSVALTVATSMFFKLLIGALGVTFVIPNVVLYALISVGLWVLAYRDIKFSTQLGLSLEIVSVTMILIVCAVVWSKFHFEIDPAQVHFKGATFATAAPAIVFAIFSWVGVESAATLGNETKNPTVIIPRVIVASTIFSGLFFTATTAVICMGFGDDASKLGNSSAPLNDITSGFGSWVTLLIYIGAFISCFACSLGQLNAFGRILYSLGRYQFVHKSMGFIHTSHRTPHIALTIGAIANGLLCIAFVSAGEINLVGYFGTIATFGFITVYFLCSICAPILLHREGTAKPMNYILGTLGGIAMLLAFVGSVYPVPAAPYNYFPYGFVVYMLIGVVWFFGLKARMPQVVLEIEREIDSMSLSTK